jgi:GMP synthase (glutamine-hydrolysing)
MQSSAKNSLRILLLQARNQHDTAKHDEWRSFALRGGLDEKQIIPYDLLEGPPSLYKIKSCDALMVGGSGEYYVSKGNLPQFDKLLDVLKESVELGHPAFASCFGFQLLVKALGGKIIYDPVATEVGTYQLTLTEDGQNDELLGSLPDRFNAQLGRKDRAERLPDGVLHLVSSDLCPYQAFRIPGKPIWTTQFHPELNMWENKKRFIQYLKGYSEHLSDEERDEKLSHFHESPETEQLIPRFLNLVFG